MNCDTYVPPWGTFSVSLQVLCGYYDDNSLGNYSVELCGNSNVGGVWMIPMSH